MDIHFWLGKESSQDEEGVAAFKTVELDDYLGGSPVQHREVQEHESAQFLEYFRNKKGIRYMKGGVASGFKHVGTKVLEPYLLHVKGKRTVRTTEVPISWDSMNEGDVFLLDLFNVIFVWIGKDANRTEKIKGMEIARQLKDEHKNCDVVTVEDGQEDKMTPDELKVFEKHLPLKSKKVHKAAAAGADEEVVAKMGQIKLYVCTDEGGTLKVQEKKSGPLVKSDLDSNDSFIIDTGEAGLWVWNGKKATKKEKDEAMRNANGYIKKKGYSKNTPVTRVIEGGEGTRFKMLFKSWPEPQASGKVYRTSKIADTKTVQTKFDVATLHSNPTLAAETQMVDDGTGKVEVFVVHNFDLVAQDKKHYGQFFAGDCYVILYTYEVGTQTRHLIYYWQGLKSTTDEKGTSALKAVELDDKYGGEPVQIRVVQNKEPPHFMAMFKGRMIIFSGGKAGWGQTGGNDGPGDSYLLQVRGTSPANTKAIQVDLRAASLNSNDVFVLFQKGAVYIWCGKGSTGDEREMAKHVSKISPREPILVFEGTEKPDFWKAIGGQEAYSSDKILQEPDIDRPPRLFQCSNASGRFIMEEITDFTQQDLVTDDVMLLDAQQNVFIWVGEGANKEEKTQAEKAAFEYINTDPTGRDPDTPVLKIKQGFEPPNFTGFFGTWDKDMWSKGKTFEELKAELGAENVGVKSVDQSNMNGSTNFSDVPKYSLEQLQCKEGEGLPEGVEAASKEIYLTEEVFQSTFGMNYQNFMELPVWKQAQLKKQHKLF
ncbi:advillin [Lingula anatina]|uniref:Advillin n=1 Tax=Lingula anatina TaxID=7574 RepID=A0A1S3JA07_LINAN|nr:advillin [Lingula anatina]|eukprot:XP_013406709.1 advillin [Lingula anatina]